MEKTLRSAGPQRTGWKVQPPHILDQLFVELDADSYKSLYVALGRGDEKAVYDAWLKRCKELVDEKDRDCPWLRQDARDPWAMEKIRRFWNSLKTLKAWDPSFSLNFKPPTIERVLPGDRVLAMSTDPSTPWALVVTDRFTALYEVDDLEHSGIPVRRFVYYDYRKNVKCVPWAASAKISISKDHAFALVERFYVDIIPPTQQILALSKGRSNGYTITEVNVQSEFWTNSASSSWTRVKSSVKGLEFPHFWCDSDTLILGDPKLGFEFMKIRFDASEILSGSILDARINEFCNDSSSTVCSELDGPIEDSDSTFNVYGIKHCDNCKLAHKVQALKITGRKLVNSASWFFKGILVDLRVTHNLVVLAVVKEASDDEKVRKSCGYVVDYNDSTQMSERDEVKIDFYTWLWTDDSARPAYTHSSPAYELIDIDCEQFKTSWSVKETTMIYKLEKPSFYVDFQFWDKSRRRSFLMPENFTHTTLITNTVILAATLENISYISLKMENAPEKNFTIRDFSEEETLQPESESSEKSKETSSKSEQKNTLTNSTSEVEISGPESFCEIHTSSGALDRDVVHDRKCKHRKMDMTLPQN